jgi:uncharacterized membrane protein
MYGRGVYSRGFSGSSGCFGYGFMNNGWGILITIGILVTIALLIYILVHNRKKVIANQGNVEVTANSANIEATVNQTSLELLKMKYVQGEITEEEYLKRKSVIDTE